MWRACRARRPTSQSSSIGTICHINLAADYRGGERQTELLIRELASRGWQQRLVIREGQELAERCADVDGLEIEVGSSNMLRAGRACKGVSLVHSHEARGVYSGWYTNWAYKLPTVITRRVVKVQNRSFFRDRAYKAAGAIVAISQAVADHIRLTYPDIRPVLISDAHADLQVDAEVSAAIRERYAGKVLIGHAGTYDHSAKGQLTIIEAARRAKDERPDWHFLLLGAGRDEELFRAKIGDLKNIELAGWVENVGDYMAAFDVFAFPSLHEALGSSVLDAMKFGLPVVASRVGGIPEFVEDGVNGVLIAPEAADELFEGIARVVDDRALSGAINLANRAKASKYTAARMAEAYEAVYRELL